MVAYQRFVALSQSLDNEHRSQAAYIVAAAYASHDGPDDERAALYAAIIGFLQDTSLKVRAALAYGLLHAQNAPRTVMLALAADKPVIARAVVQYCPVLLDIDLIAALKNSESAMIMAIAGRQTLSPRLVAALVALERADITELVLQRFDLTISDDMLAKIASKHAENEKIRAALLARPELSAFVRLQLMEIVKHNLLVAETIKGKIAPKRLERLLRDAFDDAMTDMGEEEEMAHRSGYAESLCAGQKVNTRILLNALINGRVMFFARCVSLLAQMPSTKVFGLLERGGEATLKAMLARSGMARPLCDLVTRLVIYARNCDLTTDAAARHLIVSALVQDLIVKHDGQIPDDLEEAFYYLDEQNIALARHAARASTPDFARQQPNGDYLALQVEPEQLEPPRQAA
ncbi:hypothetical protein MNBD_ALPHA12-841 [hydrothermal vent metagenome]|uniref:DUF2336 domain-containing protein n=1 Tax=hydrothermal vent metagenome TaxID=652676 RepID=A0A3B0U1S5_9ZZZZ